MRIQGYPVSCLCPAALAWSAFSPGTPGGKPLAASSSATSSSSLAPSVAPPQTSRPSPFHTFSTAPLKNSAKRHLFRTFVDIFKPAPFPADTFMCSCRASCSCKRISGLIFFYFSIGIDTAPVWTRPAAQCRRQSICSAAIAAAVVAIYSTN